LSKLQLLTCKPLCARLCAYFGIPHTVITDNDRQFVDRKLESFLAELEIKHITSFIEHPQTNGQAEASNKVILLQLKKRLGAIKGKWADELLEVLWAYRCTPQTSTCETPYNLTYGTNVMLPVEIREATVRRQLKDLAFNDECMKTELDLLEELREKAKIKEEAYK